MSISLRVKTLIGVITLILVVASSLSMTYMQRQRLVMTRQLERLGQMLAHTLAFNSEYGMVVQDRRALQDLVDGVRQEPDVVYAALIDRRGTTLAQHDGAAPPGPVLPSLAGASRESVHHVRYRGEDVIVVTHPVTLTRAERWNADGLVITPLPEREDVLGSAVVALSTRALASDLAQIGETTLSLTISIVFAAGLVSLILVDFITRPLHRLQAATRQVADGRLDVQLDETRRDELGDVNRAFNQMVRELQQARQRVEEYTRKLETTAQDLTAVNQEMEDMLRVVSHDLRAPLINIQGFAKRLEPLLTQTPIEARARVAESLGFISKGIEKMDTLLTSLLAVSRIGRKADPMQPHDLNEIWNDVVATFDHELTERAIAVVRRPILDRVCCRRNEINQVCSNLFSNAVTYMGSSERRTIELGGTARDGMVECFVRDSGIGIDTQDHDRVFHMFTRLMDVEAPGEGVGLAYVKKVVRAHGGRTWVESRRGEGSTFYFTLPADRASG